MKMSKADYKKLGYIISCSTDPIVDTHMRRPIFLNSLMRFFRDRDSNFDVVKFLEGTNTPMGTE